MRASKLNRAACKPVFLRVLVDFQPAQFARRAHKADTLLFAQSFTHACANRNGKRMSVSSCVHAQSGKFMLWSRRSLLYSGVRNSIATLSGGVANWQAEVDRSFMRAYAAVHCGNISAKHMLDGETIRTFVDSALRSTEV